MFTIGGTSGIILGVTIIDYGLHDTSYIILHFHIVLSLGTLLIIFIFISNYLTYILLFLFIYNINILLIIIHIITTDSKQGGYIYYIMIMTYPVICIYYYLLSITTYYILNIRTYCILLTIGIIINIRNCNYYVLSIIIIISI